MSFINPNYLNIISIAGQRPLNSVFKLKVNDLEDNKAFKEVESPNIIDDIFNSN